MNAGSRYVFTQISMPYINHDSLRFPRILGALGTLVQAIQTDPEMQEIAWEWGLKKLPYCLEHACIVSEEMCWIRIKVSLSVSLSLLSLFSD